jgi:hypothetical protein
MDFDSAIPRFESWRRTSVKALNSLPERFLFLRGPWWRIWKNWFRRQAKIELTTSGLRLLARVTGRLVSDFPDALTSIPHK